MTIPLPPPPPIQPGLSGRLRFDPLAPLIAVLPFIAIAGLSLSWHPAGLICAVAAVLLIIIQPRRGTLSALALSVFLFALTIGFASSTQGARVFDEAAPLARLPFFEPDQWNTALNITARIGAILMLLLVAGLLSNPEDTVRAFVVHLAMPNRIGQAGIAALGFARVLRREQRSILEAHMLRGSSLDVPIVEWPIRWLRSMPTLVAAAVRHAERVSMSMDARAFGAFDTRTELTDFSWRRRDTALVLVAFATAALLIHSVWDSGFALTPNRS